MSDPHAWQKAFPKFPHTQVAEALEILLEAVVGLTKKDPSEREDPVTQRLRLRIRQNPRFKISDFELLSQQEVYDPQDRDPELRGIPDLSFQLLNVPKPVPYFAIEAKRLRYRSQNGDFKTGNSDYVAGPQGMRCFTEDRYAEGLDSGAMLGYVYDRQLNAAEKAITELVLKHAAALKCDETSIFELASIPNPSAEVKQTNHHLAGREFKLFHILIPV